MDRATVPEKQEGGPAPSETATLLTRSNHNADGDQPSYVSIADQADRNTTAERWRDIPGFDGYQVTRDGRVRSVDRVITDRNGMSKRLQSVELLVDVRVTLSEPGRRRRTISVRALVAAAFRGEA